MTCCIVAMLIIAHVMAVLRRWGVFWGILRPVEGEDTGTVFGLIRSWLARPRVRMAAIALVAIEATAAGSWIYFEHGRHLYQLGDQAIGRLHGQTIVYSDVCDKSGTSRTLRVVIAERDALGRRAVPETAI
jgi:hypothetical protein